MLISHIQLLLVFCALLSWRLTFKRKKTNILLFFLAAVILATIMFLPVNIIYYWRVIPHLSITTCLFLSLFILNKHFTLPNYYTIKTHHWLYITIFAWLLYPLSLGLGSFSIYSIGYSPVLASIFLILSLLCWWYKDKLTSLIMILILGAYMLNLYATNNLLAYTIDPILAIYASYRTVKILLLKPFMHSIK